MIANATKVQHTDYCSEILVCAQSFVYIQIYYQTPLFIHIWMSISSRHTNRKQFIFGSFAEQHAACVSAHRHRALYEQVWVRCGTCSIFWGLRHDAWHMQSWPRTRPRQYLFFFFFFKNIWYDVWLLSTLTLDIWEQKNIGEPLLV